MCKYLGEVFLLMMRVFISCSDDDGCYPLPLALQLHSYHTVMMVDLLRKDHFHCGLRSAVHQAVHVFFLVSEADGRGDGMMTKH